MAAGAENACAGCARDFMQFQSKDYIGLNKIAPVARVCLCARAQVGNCSQYLHSLGTLRKSRKTRRHMDALGSVANIVGVCSFLFLYLVFLFVLVL